LKHDLSGLYFKGEQSTVMARNTNYKSASHPIYGIINYIYNHIDHHLYLVFGALTVDIKRYIVVSMGSLIWLPSMAKWLTYCKQPISGIKKHGF
jgi:hypothetical protein